MSTILPFRKPGPQKKHQGNTLCRSGHHKWVIDKDQVFDSKRGGLITRWLCSRCNKEKIRAL